MTTQQNDETQAAWDEIAGGCDRFVTPTHMWLANEALRRAGVGPGMRFLGRVRERRSASPRRASARG